MSLSRHLSREFKHSHSEMLIGVWIAIMAVRRAYGGVLKALGHQEDGVEQGEADRMEQIKMGGGDAERKRVFTKTKGGKVNLGWGGAYEYWIGVLTRTVEGYYMVKLGDRFFRGNGQNAWKKYWKMMWGSFSLLPILDLLVPVSVLKGRKSWWCELTQFRPWHLFFYSFICAGSNCV